MSEYVPCPDCSCTGARKVGFTWWGGALGPALLTHVKCHECGATFNGKTGQSNNRASIIYGIVTGAIVIALAVLLTRL